MTYICWLMIRSLTWVLLGCTEDISKWRQCLLGLKGRIGPLFLQLLGASHSLRLMVPIFSVGNSATSINTCPYLTLLPLSSNVKGSRGQTGPRRTSSAQGQLIRNLNFPLLSNLTLSQTGSGILLGCFFCRVAPKGKDTN